MNKLNLWHSPISWNSFPSPVDSLLGSLQKVQTSYSPSYDIVAKDENAYTISVSTPGFDRDDLEVSLHENNLEIIGKVEQKTTEEKKPEKKNDPEYIHRGIVQRSFRLSFHLAGNMKVSGADLKDGILHVHLQSLAPKAPEKHSISIK